MYVGRLKKLRVYQYSEFRALSDTLQLEMIQIQNEIENDVKKYNVMLSKI